jgi:ribosomal-protein-alanine N-acetyltransferase
MAARGTQLVALGGQQVRLGSWRSTANLGYVAPVSDTAPLSVPTLRSALGLLASRGFTEVISGAVPEPQAQPFLDAGFRVRERLHLLAHPLTDVAAPRRGVVRRGRRRDHPAALAVDRQAFEPFWQLDADALSETLEATPISRLRITGRPVDGYAVFGLAGDHGYLQRLAVHPDQRGRGLGSALVTDGLAWARRRGALRVLVNTQEQNLTALRLYRALGFISEPHWLLVLTAPAGLGSVA